MDEYKFKILKAFTDSFHESISSMTGLNVKRLSPDSEPACELPLFTIVTPFSGEDRGVVLIKSPAPAVLRLYEKYLGEKTESINDDVLDALKELAGIINNAASAKEQSHKLNFTPSLNILTEDGKIHTSGKVDGRAVHYFIEECGVFTIEVHQK